MKKAKYLFILLLFGGLYQSCIPNVDFPGRIYGTVEDKATGEPLKSAWLELNPGGLRITTGDDGAFEFPELDPNDYTLFVSKVGYVEYKTNTIEVKPNQLVKVDIQLERLPPALKVVDDNRKDVDTLDFGGADDDVARSFNIYNDGDATLEWQITKTAEWIKSISKTEGKLAAGAPQSIVVVIDRSKLGSGENKTTLHITSNSGSKQLTIMATGQIVTILNTLPVTYLNSTSVTLSGEILEDGNPKYTERGFVYSESSMPTIKDCIKKVTSPLIDDKKFSFTITGLTQGRTYFARAYVICAGQEVYSTNEVSFIPDVLSLPTFTFGGSLYYVAPDQGTATWYEAKSICSELVYAYYDDWYLPDKGELYAMYQNRSSIGGFSSNYYWSSTENNSNYRFAWYQNFSSGDQGTSEKSYIYRVRCVRREN